MRRCVAYIARLYIIPQQYIIVNNHSSDVLISFLLPVKDIVHCFLSFAWPVRLISRALRQLR